MLTTREFAKISLGAYRKEKLDGFTTRDISNNGAEMQIHFNDTHSILAFRGTQPMSLRDVWTDINVRKKQTRATGDSSSILVHSGFSEYVNKLWPDIKLHLKQATLRDHSIHFTGHSLGGAMAVLAQYRAQLAFRDYPQFESTTFGAPAVGNKAFKDAFHDLRLWSARAVNKSDIVPALPLLGFHHAGVLYPMPGTRQDWLRHFRPRPFTDHFIEAYIEALT